MSTTGFAQLLSLALLYDINQQPSQEQQQPSEQQSDSNTPSQSRFSTLAYDIRQATYQHLADSYIESKGEGIQPTLGPLFQLTDVSLDIKQFMTNLNYGYQTQQLTKSSTKQSVPVSSLPSRSLGVLLGGQPLSNTHYLQQLAPDVLEFDGVDMNMNQQMPYPGIISLLSDDKLITKRYQVLEKYFQGPQLTVAERITQFYSHSLLAQFEFWATFLCFGLFSISSYLDTNNIIIHLKEKYNLPLHHNEISYKLMHEKRILWNESKQQQSEDEKKLGPLINRLPPWVDIERIRLPPSASSKPTQYEMKPEIKNYPPASTRITIQHEQTLVFQQLQRISLIPKSITQIYNHASLCLLHYPRKKIFHKEIYAYAQDTFISMIYLHSIFTLLGISGLPHGVEAQLYPIGHQGVLMPKELCKKDTNPFGQIQSFKTLQNRISQTYQLYQMRDTTRKDINATLLSLPSPTTLPQAILNMLIGYSYQLPPLDAPHLVDAVNPLLLPHILLESRTNKNALIMAKRQKTTRTRTEHITSDQWEHNGNTTASKTTGKGSDEKLLRWSYELFCARWVLWAPILYESMIQYQCRIITEFHTLYKSITKKILDVDPDFIFDPAHLDQSLLDYIQSRPIYRQQVVPNHWPEQGKQFNYIHESFMYAYFNRDPAQKPILTNTEMAMGLDQIATRYYNEMDYISSIVSYESILLQSGFIFHDVDTNTTMNDTNNNDEEQLHINDKPPARMVPTTVIEKLLDTIVPQFYTFDEIFASLEYSPRLRSISIPRGVFVGATLGHSEYSRQLELFNKPVNPYLRNTQEQPTRPIFKSDAISVSWPYHYSTLFCKPSLDDFYITLAGFSIQDPSTGDEVELISPSQKWLHDDRQIIQSYTQQYPMYEDRSFSITFSTTTRQIETFIQSILHRHESQILMMLWRSLDQEQLREYLPTLKHKIVHKVGENTFTAYLTITDFLIIAGTCLYAPDVANTVTSFLNECKSK